jgi:predicted NBD/HSP70 family sugar kinase
MTILVVDIGGTSLKFGFSVRGRPLDDLRLFPSTLLRQGDCIVTLAALTREVIQDAGLAPDVIVSTVPGFIDRDHDRILFAANLPVLNDRRLFGNGRQKWDTSRLDCLEAYVSGRVLEIIASAHRVATEEVFEARQTNEILARDLDGFVDDQATAVVTGIAMFSPERVVLGGGLCAMRGFPRDRLVQLIEETSRFGRGVCRTEVRWASLGWKSVLYGAQFLSSQKK